MPRFFSHDDRLLELWYGGFKMVDNEEDTKQKEN
jgi:hypothetical protein